MRKAIGIDLGGTKINAALIADDGTILNKITVKTINEGDPLIIIQQMAAMVNELSVNEEVSGVGIGTAGFVDSKEGKILAVGGNIKGWAWTDVRDLMSQYTNIPVFVENDANCAAICESWLGAAKGLESFVMLTIGTGLGGATWLPPAGLWRGSNFRAGEFGHSIFRPNGRPCTCGQKGCTERYISGTGIENNYRELTGKSLSGKEITAVYEIDEKAKAAVDKFASDFGIFLASMKNLIDPQAFILGGGVIASKNLWWDRLIEEFNTQVNDASSLLIMPAQFKNEAGMLGAARLALDLS